MKATGIVRRIDDLGRVVIPKEIRRTLRLREGEPLEIYTEKDGSVIFRKYSPMGDLQEVSAALCQAISSVTKMTAAVCDRDGILTAAGTLRRDLAEKPISQELEKIITGRKPYEQAPGSPSLPVTADPAGAQISAAVPIVNQGDLIGCILLSGQESVQPHSDHMLLLLTAAQFLGGQMEP